MRTAALGEGAAVLAFRWLPGRVVFRAAGSVSVGPDGEGVEVVGQDGPADVGARPGMAFQAAAAQAVAAFEVTDAALAADAVAGQAPARAPRRWGLPAGDEDRGAVGQSALGDAGIEAAIEGDLARSQ